MEKELKKQILLWAQVFKRIRNGCTTSQLTVIPGRVSGIKDKLRTSTDPGVKSPAGRAEVSLLLLFCVPYQSASVIGWEITMWSWNGPGKRNGRWLLNGHRCPSFKSKEKREFLTFVHDPSQVSSAGKQLEMQNMPGIGACFSHPRSCQETDGILPRGKWEVSIRARARLRETNKGMVQYPAVSNSLRTDLWERAAQAPLLSSSTRMQVMTIHRRQRESQIISPTFLHYPPPMSCLCFPMPEGK